MRITILSIQRGKWFINLFIYATTTLKSTASGVGTINFQGIDACGLADGIIAVNIVLNRGGVELPPVAGTPAFKSTLGLEPPILDPLPLLTVLPSIEVCGTSRENTTVRAEGGAHIVSIVLDENTTRFCLDVPLRPNTQNTLIVSAIDNLAPPPKPIAAAPPVQIFQVDSSEIIIAKAFSRPLTTDEIETLVANGVIDLDDPTNFNVSMFTVVLTIGSFPVTITQPVVINPVPGTVSFGIGPVFGTGGVECRR